MYCSRIGLRLGIGFLVGLCFSTMGCSPHPLPLSAHPATIHAEGDSLPATQGDSSTPWDASETGHLSGTIRWGKASPTVPRLSLPVSVHGKILARTEVDNPNRLGIDSQTGGVSNVFLFLRGVDPRRAKPWPYAPVRLVMQNTDYLIQQGDHKSANRGIVKRGDSIEITSHDDHFHAVRGTGVSHFTRMFPEKNRSLSVPLLQNGMVELSSGACLYWLRGYVWVSDHPYITISSETGRFAIEQIPIGDYEIVAWHPNWEVSHHERDPESCQITRYFFKQPIEIVQKIRIEKGKTLELMFDLAVGR